MSNLTVKSISSAVSTGSTVLLHTGLCACPFTYMMPWKFLSSISNCTLTPSAKQLTSISGRGNGWIGGGVVGIGTKSNQIKLINLDLAVYVEIEKICLHFICPSKLTTSSWTSWITRISLNASTKTSVIDVCSICVRTAGPFYAWYCARVICQFAVSCSQAVRISFTFWD